MHGIKLACVYVCLMREAGRHTMVDRVKHDLWEILHYISWIAKISSQVRIIRTDSFVVAVICGWHYCNNLNKSVNNRYVSLSKEILERSGTIKVKD